MEFQYYFDNSYIESSKLTAYWPYPSSSGIFTGNNPNSGSFPATQVFSKEISLGGDSDFSLFVTFHSYVIDSPEWFRFRTQVLFSNCDGTDGWDFGILASNTLFVSSPSGEVYQFDKIWLGEKNCICLQRLGQSFTVYKYDLLSQRVVAEQSVSFKTETNLLSGPILVGYNADSDINAYRYSWYGVIDQLALVSEPVDRGTMSYLLQGFLPTTLTPTVTSSTVLYDSSWRPEQTDIPSSYLDLCQPIINDITSYFMSANSGSYIVNFNSSVRANNSGNAIINYAMNSCIGTGSVPGIAYNSSSGVLVGMSGSGWYVQDSVKVNKYRAGDSNTYSDELLFCHNFTLGASTGEFYKFAYDSLYKLNSQSTSYALSSDASYYSGFYMDGVSVNTNTRNVTLLGYFPDAVPTGVGIIAPFDTVANKFSISQSGNNYYYNGLSVPASGIVESGGYVNLTTVTETNSDELVYDSYSSFSLLSLGLSGCATGRFYPMTSLAYSGENSYDIMYRIYPTDFRETSRLHMFHNMPVFYKDNSNDFNNSNYYWQ